MPILKSTRSPVNDLDSPPGPTHATAGAPAEWVKPDANIAGRLRFESFLLELSAFFAKGSTDSIERAVDVWLEKLARFTGIDRIALWECDPPGGQMHLRHVYSAPDFPQLPTRVSTNDFPWLINEFRHGRVACWERIPEDAPAIASIERAYMTQIGAKSALGIPVEAGTTTFVLIFMCIRGPRKWPQNLVRRLQLVTEIFASAVGRLRIERSLSASESRTKAILRAFPDLIFVLSRDGIFLETHYTSHADLLMPPEEFTGRAMEDVLPAEMAKLFRGAFERAAETHGVIEVNYVLTIAGEERHFEARVVRRDDGAMVIVVRNVTERHQAASKLRDSEQQFRVAFTHSSIGVALVSLDGRFLQVNPALCRILGYSDTELLATSFQPLTHPEDLAPNAALVRRAIAGEISHYELEKRYIHKDGRDIWALLTAALVRGISGEPLYFVSQIHDISERRQSQIEIERARIELSHMSRVALVGELTTSLAHELLQPITAIQCNAAAGLHASAVDTTPEMRALLEDIADSGRRAGDVIKNVRRMLKKDSPPHMAIDLNRLVQEVAHVVRFDLLVHRVNLKLNLDSANTELEGNPVELQQVLLNLVLNATEAMSAIPVADRQLVITTAVRADAIELTVRDSGVGAFPEVLEHIFEPFVTTKASGVGVGLSICSQIVRAHKGKLSAENNPDRGMTFRCILPRA
jgi:PAS domain S-box-containing protein